MAMMIANWGGRIAATALIRSMFWQCQGRGLAEAQPPVTIGQEVGYFSLYKRWMKLLRRQTRTGCRSSQSSKAFHAFPQFEEAVKRARPSTPTLKPHKKNHPKKSYRPTAMRPQRLLVAIFIAIHATPAIDAQLWNFPKDIFNFPWLRQGKTERLTAAETTTTPPPAPTTTSAPTSASVFASTQPVTLPITTITTTTTTTDKIRKKNLSTTSLTAAPNATTTTTPLKLAKTTKSVAETRTITPAKRNQYRPKTTTAALLKTQTTPMQYQTQTTQAQTLSQTQTQAQTQTQTQVQTQFQTSPIWTTVALSTQRARATTETAATATAAAATDETSTPTTSFEFSTTTVSAADATATTEEPRDNHRVHDFYLKREKPQIKIVSNISQNLLPLPAGASAALVKPTKYHYYPHNQHIYLLPECAIQQVCNAVYVRLNWTQPLCACPSRYRDPCSASLNSDDLHTTELLTDAKRKKALTLVKTCEPTSEMRVCRTPRDWSLLALQNIRTGKSHYLVICRCPDTSILVSLHQTTAGSPEAGPCVINVCVSVGNRGRDWERVGPHVTGHTAASPVPHLPANIDDAEGPMSHDQPTYASVPGIRVYGMMCVQGNNKRRGRPLRLARGMEDPPFPWDKAIKLSKTVTWD